LDKRLTPGDPKKFEFVESELGQLEEEPWAQRIPA
jgi:hypothetical protein